MLKNVISVLIFCSAIAVYFFPNVANAGSRYSTPPPVVLSPDLTAPWVLQLRRPAVNKRTQSRSAYRVRPSTARTPVRTSRSAQRVWPIFQPFTRRNNSQRARVQTQPASRYTTTTGYNVPKPRQVAFQQQTAPAKKKKASRQMDPKFEPQLVSYASDKSAGTIIIDTNNKFLYLILDNGQARRYGVGVGKPGFEWAGTHKISRKSEWPDWRPPAQMIAREKKKGRDLSAYVEGGPHNPLGARALYLGSSLYRIHGTNSPWTIGQAVSSGCIRMRNEDVMDLYERVGVGTRVVVS